MIIVLNTVLVTHFFTRILVLICLNLHTMHVCASQKAFLVQAYIRYLGTWFLNIEHAGMTNAVHKFLLLGNIIEVYTLYF